MRLSLKLFLFIIPLILVPLATLGGMAYYVSSKQAFEQATQAIKAETRQTTQQFSNTISQVEATLGLFSQSSVLKSYIHLDSDQSIAIFDLLKGPLLEEFQNFASAYPDYYEFYLITPNEKINLQYNHFIANNEPEQSLTLEETLNSNQLWLVKLKKLTQQTSEEPLIAFLYDDRLQKNVLLGLHPITKTNQPAEHFLAVSVNSESLLQSLRRPGNPDNKVFITNQRNEVMLGKGITDFESVDIKRSNNSGMYQARVNGLKFWLHEQELPHNYKIISLLPSQLIDLQIQSITSTTILISLLCIGLTPILLIYLINRLVITPFEQLLQGHEIVSSGKLNFRLPEGRKDEIGNLFSAFNNMVYELRLMQRNLELHRDQLEQKIQLSTQQLRESNNQLEQSRVEAEQANAMKSHFLANMSHEMRTPLTAIIGFSEHAISHDNSPAERKNAMHTVIRNANHLLNLINDVLDITKIEAGKLDVEQTEIFTNEVLHDVDTLIAEQALNKQIQFIRDYQFPLPEKIISDGTRLKQILINLLNNAVKFTKYGHVKLKVFHKAETHQTYFEVSDTGIGLTDEQIKRLFKPFEQADTSTTRKFGGTGLGLSISKFLSEKLGGGISVVSTPDQGSTFTVWIDSGEPVSDKSISSINHEEITQHSLEQVEEDRNSKADIAIEDLGGQILLAEDNKDNQALISLLIKRTKAELMVVENGQQAVEEALSNEFNLILMDMQMPVMGGLEATELLRASGCDTPIVALTANFMLEEREQQKNAGCNNTLAKPIDKELFFKTLGEYLPGTEEDTASEDSMDDELINDPAYQAIVLQFKGRLEETLSGLDKAWETKDWDTLASLAHGLKGSAGMFGFPAITEQAAQLEKASRNKEEDNSYPALLSLKALCDGIH
ncbi:MAG: response regulator [Cellvibrionaceae bacterium]